MSLEVALILFTGFVFIGLVPVLALWSSLSRSRRKHMPVPPPAPYKVEPPKHTTLENHNGK